MDTIGTWQVDTDWEEKKTWPTRLAPAEVGLERHLEAWIEHDPALLERDLVIVARQLRLDGGPLDLLALDPQGRWVLIEVKRGQLRRDVIAQAIDYASSLASVDPEWLRAQCDAYLRSELQGTTLDALLNIRGRSLEAETDGRDVVIYLVGTSYDAGLERMVGFLAQRADLSVRIVTFSAFMDATGDLLLTRKIHESADEAGSAAPRVSRATPSPDALLVAADANGVGGVMRLLYDAAIEVGFYPRTYATSIMFAPPANKSRALLVVWTLRQKEPGVAKGWLVAEAFEQFYGIKEADLVGAVGQIGALMLDSAGAERLAAGLRSLLPTDAADGGEAQ